MTNRARPDDDVLPFAVPPTPPVTSAKGRPARTSRRAASVTVAAATVLPVARVAVDVALSHLDRPFDYLVPENLAAQAVPGVRVRVRFAGQLVDGFVLERIAETEHGGRLAFLERVVSPEVVLTPEVLALATAVARRWAGTLADVLRLAVPPRHARVEAERTDARPTKEQRIHASSGAAPRPSALPGLSRYRSGQRFLDALRAGGSPRAVWTALPGGGWPDEIAELVAATAASGRGVLVVVPDGRDASRVAAAIAARRDDTDHVVLTADLGPAQRYRRFLAVSRGETRVVVGTRAAAFAPVHDLGLVIVWDDGDDLHAEPRAPYPHARDVALLRAHLASAAAVVGGHAVTAEGARLVESRWARYLSAERAKVRAAAPAVIAGDDPAAGRHPSPGGRLPSAAWQAAHDALERNLPVLVQVPRGGYLPALACANCRTPARCVSCLGPLGAGGSDSAPSCRWCGRLAAGWQCPECGDTRLRAVVVGARRTAEELGRAFPGATVRTSAAGDVLDQVPAGRQLVIATPGAEPQADGGYGAALLLDGWAMLSRADLRAGEEALRRWFNAAALVRSSVDGGRVVVLADASLRAVQALVRWDPAGHAERELAERSALHFPPVAVFAEIVGEAGAVDELLAGLQLSGAVELLGPVPVNSDRTVAERSTRALLRAPRAEAADLARTLHDAQGVRSAHKRAPVRVRIDPVDIG
ncbi:MAG: primosomal protein N' [Acidothermaceae bacterium]